MKRALLTCIALTLLAVPACKKGPIAVIRNPNVYLNEMDFDQMVHKQAVQHLRYWLTESCSCKDGAWDGDRAEACEKTAKHILVVETRDPYHTALMEYNGSFTDDRPPKDPPAVPETTTLCPGGE
jgi:hypothetical protein